MLGRPLLGAVVLGQFMSILLTITAVCSTLIAQSGANIPTTQALLSYILLTIVATILNTCKRVKIPLNQCKYFAIISLFNIQGDYLIIKAYQYTNITNISLLSSFTVPCAMIFSYILLQQKFSTRQIIGGVISILGVSLLIIFNNYQQFNNNNNSDNNEQKQNYGSQLIGNLLVLISACLYALSNTLQEKLLKNIGIIDSLIMIGQFGTFWASLQAFVLERNQVIQIINNLNIIIQLGMFAFALTIFYLLTPSVLIWGGSTLLNLSLLTTQLWIAIMKVLFFGGFSVYSGSVFCGSFVTIVIGMLIYSFYSSEQQISFESSVNQDVAQPLLSEQVA
eukprot:TRINITY_DN10321_c0_g1_i5.p2 TRINITY_DN10321_c0_g1~~TRINITY_DN10321_c0_g1_i5.p2  ORF type:complete len:336 (+),score=6.23 TRINITY_DN10321_c0_g1_i5:209-1216(+)